MKLIGAHMIQSTMKQNIGMLLGNSGGVSRWRNRFYMLVWIVANGAVFVLGYLLQRDDPNLSGLNGKIGTSVYVSRGAGLVLAAQGMLVVLPMCRNLLSTLQQVRLLRRWIPFDKNVQFHIVIVWTMLLFTIVHVSAHLFNFLALQKLQPVRPQFNAFTLLWSLRAGWTGVTMISIMMLMYASSMKEIKKRGFELFFSIHHLAIVFLILFCVHGTGCFVKNNDGTCKPYGSWRMVVVSLGIWCVEKAWRAIRSRRQLTITKVVRYPGNTMEIQFSKEQTWLAPGQYVRVNVPEISGFQWHPFTVTSAPEEPFFSIHVRIVGDWTEALAQRLGYYEASKATETQLTSMKATETQLISMNGRESKFPLMKKAEILPLSIAPCTIHIDGPFGSPSQDVFDYETVFLIGAGIGVTPFASILKSIWFRYQDPVERERMKIKKVTFTWICRETESFSWFMSMLHAFEKEFTNDFIELNIFVTATLAPHQLTNIFIRSTSKNDPVTKLKSRTLFGRPRMGDLLARYAAQIETMRFDSFAEGKKKTIFGFSMQQSARVHHDVGVFYCGPEGLRDSLQDASDAQSTPNCTFHFHSESF